MTALLTSRPITNQTRKQKRLWIPSEVTGSSNPCTPSHIFHDFVATSWTIIQTQALRQHFLLSPVILSNYKLKKL